jgi:Family of unknown function (DUF5317)
VQEGCTFALQGPTNVGSSPGTLGAGDRCVDAPHVLFAAVLLICLVSVPLAGGRLSLLSEARFRGAGLAVAGLVIQILVISVLPTGARGLHEAAHLASYVLLGAMLALNLRIRWLWLVGLGGLLNFVAIAANGGVMPASHGALARAGSLPAPGHFINSTQLAHPQLLFLGDVFAIPAPWAHNVFSVGDVLIAVGALLLLHGLTGSRLTPSARRRAPQRPTLA